VTGEYRGLLEREAVYLHGQFFGGPVEREIVDRYVAAHERYVPEQSERARRIMETVLNARLDAEAIEFALRVRRRERILTSKIQTLFYLAEVRSKYYGAFVNAVPGRARAWSGLVKAVIASAVKFLKGAWLVRKYGL
jgi:hypothetical protein